MTNLLLAALVLLAALPAGKAKPKRAPAPAVRPAAAAKLAVPRAVHRCAPYVGAVSANADTGEILFSDNADREAYPASVTKLMTLLLVLEDVRAGKYALDTMVTATPDVNRCEASWVGLKTGDTMTVNDLCLALMVESANDAAIALGVHAAGSFDAFIARMNARAAALGMRSTTYYNPNGLPPNASKRYPWKSFNVTTANDQLKLALALLKLPEVLRFTSVKTCGLIRRPGGFRVEVTRRVNEPEHKVALGPGETLVKNLRNHNNIMNLDKLHVINPDGTEAVDGLKTGYIDAGGSSIVLTGKRKTLVKGRFVDRRVVVVVLGSDSAAMRDENASRLLNDALGALAW